MHRKQCNVSNNSENIETLLYSSYPNIKLQFMITYTQEVM